MSWPILYLADSVKISSGPGLQLHLQSNGFRFGIAVMITSYKRHFTLVPVTKLAEQLVPQLIPVGLIVTFPTPLPVIVTVWCW
jgi:hypothetical protein